MSRMDPYSLMRLIQQAEEMDRRIRRAGGIDKLMRQAQNARLNPEVASKAEELIRQSENTRQIIENAGGIENLRRRYEEVASLAEGAPLSQTSRGGGDSSSTAAEAHKKPSRKLAPQIDIYKADAAYKPFPPFSEWSLCVVDTPKWDHYSALVEEHRGKSEEILRRSREIVERAAAVDTGAIEGLYDTNEGITFTIATQAASWETVLDSKAMSFFESQLRSYEHVLDFATQKVPLAEAWIRELHAQICQNQDTYAAHTAVGPQQLPLPKGEYKLHPNHVRLPDGSIHAYAPVDSTPEEMHRLAEEMRSEKFLAAHPVLQASYAHYAFVVIHPFADGNGRVARALASVFTYRSNSIPLLILMENRKEYLESLRTADAGSYQPFVDFIFERGLDAIRLLDESIRTALAPSKEDALAAIKKLYVTRGGYSQEDVDKAGGRFLEVFQVELSKMFAEVEQSPMLTGGVGSDNSTFETKDPKYRLPLGGKRRVTMNMQTAMPAMATYANDFLLEVPKDCDREDGIIIRNARTGEVLEARITELWPDPTPALHMRVRIAAERIIAQALEELSAQANKALRG